MGRVAVVGWATDSGVGRELCDAVANLPIVGAFVLTHALKRNRFDMVPEPVRYISHGRDPVSEMQDFLEKRRPDVVLTWEGPPRSEFTDVWRRAGVRWINVVHWDWFPGIDALKGAELIAPNEMCQRGLQDRYGLSSTVLPVPVDIPKFPFVRRLKAVRFGMAYGAGGFHDRRCLGETLAAWRLIKDAPILTISTQGKAPQFVPTPATQLREKNLWDPAEVYADWDIAIQPSRFEGVGLSLLEAQACGLPVLTLDAEPMRELAPDLLVPAIGSSIENVPGHQVDAWTPEPADLARAVDGIRGKDISDLSVRARSRAEKFSWYALGKKWLEFLEKGYAPKLNA